MIECVITLDYEIYGNGTGSLKELAYEPTRRLAALFRERNKRFVVFAEVAELEMIEAEGSDPAIELVKEQLRELRQEEFEIGLHLHPWWYRGRYENGHWILDYREYNLCALPKERIVELIDRSLSYLRRLLHASDFTPLTYRGGHLLFQPTEPAASVLADRGVRMDSSVYKGGVWQQQKLDYRRALKNGYYWRFTDSVNVPDPAGKLLEIPILTQMVLPWKLLTGKRVSLQKQGGSATQAGRKLLSRLSNYMRFSYPLKLDFCSMGIRELIAAVERVLRADQRDPASFRPIVAIGHTKELVDYETVEQFLSFLDSNGIRVSTFRDVYERLASRV